jgi:D-glycero-alpha-D-manno-heptose-7-phosphate kinase
MIITQTPLRISFLGGNTDFPSYYLKYGGVVLTTTIDKYVYCIVKNRFDDLIKINYSVKESVEKVDDIKHDLVREAMRLVGVGGGIEITFISDIPTEGCGLGSSSSVLVGLLIALHRYKGETLSSEQIATEACEIELIKLQRPIGVQDQYIAALGGLRAIRFPYRGDSELIDLPSGLRNTLDNSLMLFHTGLTRKSTEILSSVKLDKNILDHNKNLAELGICAVKDGDINKLGELLNEYWQLKKKLGDKISNSDIDKMYSDAIGAGAIGGKIAGAGGGGFLMLIVPSEKRSEIRHALRDYKELPVRLERDGGKIIFDIRRYE